ncbi:multiple organellar RNA editing factor 8, chloroplastic/mitochondrial-like [Hordeum vulgare subsp. vulgare]|uniref:multiple organellar RNA editing factor 8, chloroplastic/mitochondrial-like n=1 Tax=Hordeum vulgare subsp. vulgare TaxID=112509 RepID=UPI000B470830|nr:multiple organellar RNA editing factor 8, chloroplastic/mitochondrial-like [Hordeum vulgare subsp. vulgare]
MASASRALLLSRASPLHAAASRFLRPLAAAGSLLPAALVPSHAAAPWAAARRFATQPANSSLRDSSPNWSNRPPKETILLDGCDFEHWLVVMEPPPGDGANPDVTRDEIIDGYIKTLAQVVGSEDEARMKIYSVSTRHYFAFGALVSEELSYKLKELPKVRWVLPDSYLDVRNKDYGGEPFIDGQAVPYDPKYHEEWVRNNARANERSRRNDRPRNFDRSRNFERRRENTQAYQSGPAPPGQSQMPPHDAAPPRRPPQGPPPPSGAPPNYQSHAPNPQAGYVPGGGPNYQNAPPPPGYQGAPTPGYQAGNQGYQGNPGGNMQNGPGPAYLSNNPGYHQGGGPGVNPPPPFAGGNQPPPYQGSGPSYGGGAPDYQGQPGNPGYQGGGNYNNAAPPPYEGRDGPGRNYQ